MEYKFLILSSEQLEGNIIKLQSVVSYDCLRNPKSTDDVLPNKLRDIFVFDASIRFYLYPFAEIVYGNE